MSNVGKIICERRKALGMTQEELAQKLGYKSKSSINKIELGVSDLPQRKIVQFAAALDTTPGYLMGWVSEERIEDDKKIGQRAKLTMRMREDDIYAECAVMLSELDEDSLRNFHGILSAMMDK